MEAEGYTATRHQAEVGTGYFDQVSTVISRRPGLDPGPGGIHRGTAVPGLRFLPPPLGSVTSDGSAAQRAALGLGEPHAPGAPAEFPVRASHRRPVHARGDRRGRARRGAASVRCRRHPRDLHPARRERPELSQAADAAGDYLRMLDRIEELGLDAEISLKLTQLGFDLDPDVTATTSRGSSTARPSWGARARSTWSRPTTWRPPSISTSGNSSARRTWALPPGLPPPHLRRHPAAAAGRTVDPARERCVPRAERARVPGQSVDRRELPPPGEPPGEGRREEGRAGIARRDLIARIATALGGHDAFEVAMLYGIRTDNSDASRQGLPGPHADLLRPVVVPVSIAGSPRSRREHLRALRNLV